MNNRYSLEIFESLTTKDKLATLKILEDTTDDIVEIHKGVYSFIDKKNRIKLININTMEVMDKSYNIKCIKDDKIVMYSRKDENSLSDIGSSIIIDLNTFETLLEVEYILNNCDDLLYTLSLNSFDKELEETLIYNIQGNEVYRALIGFNVHMKRLGNTNIYMLEYRVNQCVNNEYSIEDFGELLRYNKDNKKCYRLAVLKHPIYNIISNTHVIFNNYETNCNGIVINMQKIEDGNASELSKIFNNLITVHTND